MTFYDHVLQGEKKQALCVNSAMFIINLKLFGM